MNQNVQMSNEIMRYLVNERPDAQAIITGAPDFAEIHGVVYLYQIPTGVIVTASVENLPSKESSWAVYALHIHNGTACVGTAEVPFAGVGSHYNPYSLPHPYHAGDLEPLFANVGYAWYAFFTNRFTVDDVIGKPILIHSGVDDFITQPYGGSGERIACGLIQRVVNGFSM
ncbi:MAG: superoxide dismutase family protein [Eubacteriales bacterium]